MICGLIVWLRERERKDEGVGGKTVGRAEREGEGRQKGDGKGGIGRDEKDSVRSR